jgi:secreted Zn-dependent insulinase-like peptidase
MIRNIWVIFFMIMTSSCALQTTTTNIVQSPNDTRDVAALTLDNGLEILVISDPDTDKAAAAMDINAGSFHDPNHTQGLAHFLEHMLFLGTDKYPVAGDYEKFLTAHGGHHNAFTAGEHTNYFFDVDPDHFEQALDRFSRFFVAPTMDSEFIDRERHAVDSEYHLKINDDWRRLYQVIKENVNPEHPYAKFSVGNLETLVDSDEGTLREKLLSFYQSHYYAQNMRLVILGQEPLEQLKSLAINKFSEVPAADQPETTPKPPLWLKDNKGIEITTVPYKEQRQLQLSFVTPPTKHLWQTKPSHYLSHIIGHEGNGSIHSYLKNQGLIDWLSAGQSYNSDDAAVFSITMGLTPTGVEQYQTIVTVVFDMINKLQAHPIEEWIYDELRSLSEVDFRFKEKSDPIHEVSRLATNLHQYPANKVFAAPYRLEKFVPEQIQELLESFRPDNMQLVLTYPEAQTSEEAKWYSTPYSASQLAPESIAAWTNSEKIEGIYLPHPNPFVPEQFDIVESQQDFLKPQKVVDDSGVELWMSHSSHFSLPKQTLFAHLSSPITSNTVENGALAWILVELTNDALNTFSYPAQIAGLNYSLAKDYTGIKVQVDGYSDKQSLLLQNIMKTFVTGEFSSEQLSIIKDKLRRRWENTVRQPPYHQTQRKLYQTLYSPTWLATEYLSVLPDISLDDVISYQQDFFKQMHLRLLVHGNTTKQQALTLKQVMLAELPDFRDSGYLAPTDNMIDTENPLRYAPATQPDAAVLHYYQSQNNSYADIAAGLVLQRMIKSPFYTQLRTTEQLGYVVYSAPMTTQHTNGLILGIQSSAYSAEHVSERVNHFIDKFETTIKETDEQDVKRYIQSVLSDLEQEPVRLSEEADRFWHSITLDDIEFIRRESIINAVQQLDLSAIISYYNQNIKGNSQRKLIIHSRSM